MLWRMTNTGMHHAEDRPWRDAQRDWLMEMAQTPKRGVEVLVSDRDGEGGEDGERVRVEKVKNQSEPETCKELQELFD